MPTTTVNSQEPDTQLEGPWKQAFRKKLLAWYARNARDLPWRQDRDPYRVWLSEVMLQQTQVETVRPYFAKFLRAFPTVGALAAADESEVLRLWEGLGYYRRARSLHAAAQRIMDHHGGRFPSDVKTLQKLPGVGRYTAGAIASIAFDQPAPILEANTIRLFSRLIAYRGDATSTTGQKLLWQLAKEVLPRKKFSEFNQALMELGSLVCTPRAPACDRCPVASLCEARGQGVVDSLGPTTKKLVLTDSHEAAVVVRHDRRLLVRQCVPGERWAGLWDFPRFALDAEGPLLASQTLAENVERLTGVACEPGGLLKTFKHGVTRYRITLDCYTALRTGGRIRTSKQRPVRWVSAQELNELPLSVTGRKIAKLIAARRRKPIRPRPAG